MVGWTRAPNQWTLSEASFRTVIKPGCCMFTVNPCQSVNLNCSHMVWVICWFFVAWLCPLCEAVRAAWDDPGTDVLREDRKGPTCADCGHFASFFFVFWKYRYRIFYLSRRDCCNLTFAGMQFLESLILYIRKQNNVMHNSFSRVGGHQVDSTESQELHES